MEHLIGQFDLVVTNTILGWPMVQAAKAAATPCIWLIHEGQYGLDIARNDPTVAKTFAMAEKGGDISIGRYPQPLSGICQ